MSLSLTNKFLKDLECEIVMLTEQWKCSLVYFGLSLVTQ